MLVEDSKADPTWQKLANLFGYYQPSKCLNGLAKYKDADGKLIKLYGRFSLVGERVPESEEYEVDIRHIESNQVLRIRILPSCGPLRLTLMGAPIYFSGQTLPGCFLFNIRTSLSDLYESDDNVFPDSH